MAPLSVVPFVLILLGIAVLPLARADAWSKNGNKALFVGAVTLPAAIYLAITDASLLGHAAVEYVSFIILLGSLFVVAGGIVLEGDLRSTPLANTALLTGGAILASLIGTTGASMLLIRPFLRANAARDDTRHLPVFFIFIVSNAGGLLTPLGDPPLFLGFLRGVPFTWTLQLYPEWLFVNAALLAIFAFVDWRLSITGGTEPERPRAALKISGLHNLAFLAMVVASAALAPAVWREALMLAAAALSMGTTKKELRAANGFTFHPIEEVAILFAGIFVTMQPALAILRERGPELGVETARQFFFVSGALSSVLDNAPTYLTFFTVAQSLARDGMALVGDTGVPEHLLVAISLGSVLMGANTYIGNGPNFMVKSIADEAGFRTPSFFGYVGWSAIFLFPLWVLVSFLFL
ncbi:sodium:proton antiporter [Myxococcota bacterium]|nr:sodium:proton antiporter [Myxococcota bacterium]